MNPLTRIVRRVRLLFRKSDVERELTNEVRQHLEMEAEDLVRRGWTAGNARREAHRRLGGVEQTKEHVRDARGGRFVDDLVQDIRYAQRSLRKDRGFTFVAIVVLALGIGANTAVYSVVSRVLLEPLPFRDADRLVAVWETSLPERPRNLVSPGTYLDWRDRNTVFDALEAFATVPTSFSTMAAGEPMVVQGTSITSGLLPMLGVTPTLGRGFIEEESASGAERVVLLSDGLWRRAFGADPAVLGRAIALSDASYTIVGVLPADFRFPSPDTELWTVVQFFDGARNARTGHPYEVIGRLAADETVDTAHREMAAIAGQLRQERPAMRGWDVRVDPLIDSMIGDVRPALLVLAIGVGLVLLVACANVSAMLLVRATVRRREVALRAALGATRRRLAQQFLTESLILSVAAGVLGYWLAWWIVSVLPVLVPTGLPRASTLALDSGAVWFTVAVSVAAGVTFGLLPAWQSGRVGLASAMPGGSRGGDGGRSEPVRSALVVAQVAVAVVMLVGAGLLMRSFVRLMQVDPGFDTTDVWVSRIALSGVREPGNQRA